MNRAGVYGSKGLADPNNQPGSRFGANSWNYNGKLYMFGGYGKDENDNSGTINDMWEYSIANNNWAWIGGSKVYYQYGSYGIQFQSSVANIPGGRYGAADAQIEDKFYLFGGFGASQTDIGHLNDLWSFNINSGEWTWLKGAKETNQSAVYGTIHIPENANTPGAKLYSTMRAYNEKLYLFGGALASSQNDFFEYNPSTNYWTWEAGSPSNNSYGNYGTINVPSTSNILGARYSPISWYHNHKIYFFGGYGYASVFGGHLNDLWAYVPTCAGSDDFYTTQNGNWSDPDVWSCGRVPENTASIGIKGHTITVYGDFGIRGIEFTGGNLIIPNTSALTYYPILLP